MAKAPATNKAVTPSVGNERLTGQQPPNVPLTPERNKDGSSPTKATPNPETPVSQSFQNKTPVYSNLKIPGYDPVTASGVPQRASTLAQKPTPQPLPASDINSREAQQARVQQMWNEIQTKYGGNQEAWRLASGGSYTPPQPSQPERPAIPTSRTNIPVARTEAQLRENYVKSLSNEGKEAFGSLSTAEQNARLAEYRRLQFEAGGRSNIPSLASASVPSQPRTPTTQTSQSTFGDIPRNSATSQYFDDTGKYIGIPGASRENNMKLAKMLSPNTDRATREMLRSDLSFDHVWRNDGKDTNLSPKAQNVRDKFTRFVDSWKAQTGKLDNRDKSGDADLYRRITRGNVANRRKALKVLWNRFFPSVYDDLGTSNVWE